MFTEELADVRNVREWSERMRQRENNSLREERRSDVVEERRGINSNRARYFRSKEQRIAAANCDDGIFQDEIGTYTRNVEISRVRD